MALAGEDQLMAKGRDETGYTGGILNSDPFINATNSGEFKLGKRPPAFPGSGMTQARNAAASRAMGQDEPMPNPEPSLPPPEGGMPNPEGDLPAPSQSKTYGSEGDPYEYQVNPDGSVKIISGPTGEGMDLKTGPAYQAIMGQIASGQLKPKAEDPVTAMPDEQKQKLGWEDPRTELPRLEAARK